MTRTVNGDVLSDNQIAAKSAEERLALAHRMRPTHSKPPRSWAMAHALPDCLGFMVTRVHETGADAGQRRVLPTWLAFSDQSSPQWIEQDSPVWPIRSFQRRERPPCGQDEKCMPPATSFFGRVSIATRKRQTLTEVYGFAGEQI